MGLIDAPLKDSKAHPEHPLQLTSVNTPFICNGCSQPGFGVCYQCTESACGDIFHEECVRPEDLSWHPLSKGCKFIFTTSGLNSSSSCNSQNSSIHRFCSVCCSEVKGSFYTCHKHDHFIHPACMKLDHRIPLDGDKYMELRGDMPSKCHLCGHKHAFEGMKGWSYVSSCGRLCMHIKCARDKFLESWKKKNLAQYSMGSRRSTRRPDATISLVTNMMFVETLPSMHATDSRKRKRTPLILYKPEKPAFPLKKYATALVKTAFPAIICSIFRVFAASPF